MGDPIWEILKNNGQSVAWFARERLHYSYVYVKGVKSGRYPVTPEFRRRAALGLGLPESALFRDAREEVTA